MRMLYWNIQNITSEKYYDRDVQRVIADALLPGPGPWNDISLYVIVEVHTRATAGRQTGTIYDTSGTRGLYLLQGMLAGTSDSWRCVPPVSVGTGPYSEAVGILYRSDRLTFRGPHVWSNYGPVPADVIGTTSANAPQPWRSLLPGGGSFTAAAYPEPWKLYDPFKNAGAPAPQISYPTADSAGFWQFPGPDNRAPVRAQFNFTNSQNTPCILDLFAAHVSPGYWDNDQRAGPAIMGTASVSGIPDITKNPLPTDNIQLVVGDFNVPTQWTGYFKAYGGFLMKNYIPSIGGATASFYPRGTPTHFNTKKPTPYANDKGGAGYLNWEKGSIDNIVYKNGPGGTPRVTSVQIIDQVLGAPTPWGSELEVGLGSYSSDRRYAKSSFRGWSNFGHIVNRIKTGSAKGRQGASDHMPLLVEFD